jgi:dihydroorotase-like cyclic amidohydrolase
MTVVDPEMERVLDTDLISLLKGRNDGSIYAGRKLQGWPVATVRAGQIVCRDDELSLDQPPARFVPGVAQTSV